jgi:uncharacterized membrane protein YdjX (TVP38/TMEM64 family)
LPYYWAVAICYWPLAARCWLLTVKSQLPEASDQKLVPNQKIKLEIDCESFKLDTDAELDIWGEFDMEEVMQPTVSNRKKALVKALILVAFIIGAILTVRFTPIKQYLTPEMLGQYLDMSGFWGPIIFIVIYAVGICLFLPGTLLTALGAAIFGAYWGFIWVWIGAMIGASVSFIIGRTLGREFAATLIGDKLKKYDDAIERNGFATVLYLRLVYFPFTAMNFGMGLTKVRFWDYVAGTGLGIIVGTFIFTFFIGTLKEVWASGNWGELISFKVFFSIGLFIFSFFIPKIIKKIKKEET